MAQPVKTELPRHLSSREHKPRIAGLKPLHKPLSLIFELGELPVVKVGTEPSRTTLGLRRADRRQDS